MHNDKLQIVSKWPHNSSQHQQQWWISVGTSMLHICKQPKLSLADDQLINCIYFLLNGECNITYTVFHLRPAKDQIIFLVLLLNSYISENSVNLMSQCVFRVHDVEVGPLQELSYHGTCFSFSVLTWFPSANPIPLIGELWQSPSSPVGSISSVRWPHAGNRCICNRHHSQ